MNNELIERMAEASHTEGYNKGFFGYEWKDLREDSVIKYEHMMKAALKVVVDEVLRDVDELLEEMGAHGGRYNYINGTQLVADARKVHGPVRAILQEVDDYEAFRR